MTSKNEDATPLTLRELADTLHDGRWLLAGSVALALLLGVLSIPMREPVYRADGLLQIEDRTKTLDPLRDGKEGYVPDIPAEAEIDLIRSRSVVLEVIRDLRLDVSARPELLPVIGRLLARGEQLRVDSLEVPPELVSKPLTLVVRDEREYVLHDPTGAVLVGGRVGALASGGGVSILVAGLSAKPGRRFSVVKQSPAEAVGGFLSRLTVSERGRNTGVIALELRGSRPEQIQAELEALIQAYLRRDVEHRARTAERRLEFVNSQLPVLKENLEQAEARLKQYRVRTGQLDINLESKAIIDRGAELDTQLTQLNLQISELRQRFTESHPSVVALNTKIRQLVGAKHRLEARAETRPDTELAWVRLDRDVKVASELYVHLLAKAQELAVWKAAGIGGVRLVDAAFAQPRPVKPDAKTTLAISLLGGVALGLGAVLGRRGLSRGVHSAAALEKALGLPVYACLPKSRCKGKPQADGTPLAFSAPDDPFVESLRTLRARLCHELDQAANKVVLLTSSRPHLGSAFVAANLGVLFAGTGRRVLLVDADLRKGPLSRHFPQARDVGLAELLAGGSLEPLLSATCLPNLRLLASGGAPLAPSELLSRPALPQALEHASAHFDVVLCVAPPVLAVSDAAIVGRFAGSSLLVVKADEHSVNELELALSHLRQCGARPSGFVINAVPADEPRRSQARFHARFEYR